MHQADSSFRHLCFLRLLTQRSKQIQPILSQAAINALLPYCLSSLQRRRLAGRRGAGHAPTTRMMTERFLIVFNVGSSTTLFACAST
jgi:hypothetical protein